MVSSPYPPIFLTKVLCLCSLCLCMSIPWCHEEDMSALLEFKNSFIIDEAASFAPYAYPRTKSWEHRSNSSRSWDGVECDKDSGRVVTLDLSSSCLYGSIDSTSSLFRLVHLQRLNLADNDFNGSRIRPEFIYFPRLKHLNLSGSAFLGQIPSEISKLTELVSLDVSCGTDWNIRPELLELRSPGLSSLIQNLTKLQHLRLNNVVLSSEVPQSVSNLSSLRTLSLADTQVHGVFPARVFQLPHLQYIDLAYNSDLNGHLPEFNLTSSLQILCLRFTNFSGRLPASLGDLQSLLSLDLSSAHFEGPLPHSIGNLRSLNYLDMECCMFSGSIPSSFSNLSELTYLNIGSNQFSTQKLKSFSWLWKLTKAQHLNMKNANLQGEIPSSIGNMSHIVSLELDGNGLNGSLPPQIMNFTQLAGLNLNNNQLSGHIPSWLMNLTQLTTLYLSNNTFHGLVPTSISQLQNLKFLWLSGNRLSGTVELSTFLQLTSLSALQLSWNNLTVLSGTKSNGTLPQLIGLGLSSCNLSGFPSFLKEQQVIWLDLSNNNIHGEIPGWLWNMSIYNLEYMNLSQNFLTGFAQSPPVLPWKNLVALDLSSNLLQGSVPDPPPSIQSYLFSNNYLTGEFPQSICNLSSLLTLDLSSNSLTGMLPSCLGNTSGSLSILNLQSNKLHGTIPSLLTCGTHLKLIDFSQNDFQGRLPRSLGNCSMLEFINFGNNQLTDTYPSWIESLPRLRVLILRSNQFYGVIGRPSSNSSFLNLHVIDLSLNSFTGNLPREYFQSWDSMKVIDEIMGKTPYMQQNVQSNWYYSDYVYSMRIINKGLQLYYPKILNIFTAIDLSGNMFEGEIPDTIGDLKELHLLNLSNNYLMGRIPASLGNVRALESLDLSRNRLTGKIPQELNRLNSLEVCDVSNNNLSGPIPTGKQFDTFPESYFKGNKGLCGNIISKKCPPYSKTETAEASEDEDSKWWIDWKVVLMGYGSGLVIGIVIGAAFVSVGMVTIWITGFVRSYKKLVWFISEVGCT